MGSKQLGEKQKGFLGTKVSLAAFGEHTMEEERKLSEQKAKYAMNTGPPDGVACFVFAC